MSLRYSPLSWRCLSFTDKKVRVTPKRNLLCRANLSSSYAPTSSGEIPLQGVEDDFVRYLFGKKKATDVAHSVWKHVVRRGDTVVDATCGNGYDTLKMVKLVADDESGNGGGAGRVYGMDIQKDALANTRQMLNESLSPNEERLVQLFPVCHSKMEEVIPKEASVRLVAFNLGYLPGGDKAITTMSETTRLALESATRIVGSGGLISVIVYVGHPTGREEFETVQGFASGLSTNDWICSKLQMLNRPLAPVPIFMFRR